MSHSDSVTVVICAYTDKRWSLLEEAVASAIDQRRQPLEVIVCIDHNPELYRRAVERFASDDGPVVVRVIENRHEGRLGAARTTALEEAKGDVLAFLDDDARAEPDWLERLVSHLDDPEVLAVGGAPHPVYGKPRPAWFPEEYNWVFGCVYKGLPTTAAPVRHLIGASMAARRADLTAIGGFHSDNHDDMDMCHRLSELRPSGRIVFEPAAVVRHFVHPERLTWQYFWRRCFFVNRGKVAAFHTMGEAANLGAEREFARKVLTTSVIEELRAFASGDGAAGLRAGAIVAGLGLAAAGYGVGTAELWLKARGVLPGG